jgi:hypothetical protein
VTSHYTTDVFISYSSQDREWADKLAKDLELRGIETFMDTERLVSGDTWRPALQDAVATSRHLVVLWSAQANSSPWVQKEMAWFDADRLRQGVNSLLIPVLLDETRTTFGDRQQITDLLRASAYAAGADQVDSGLWGGVVGMVADAVNSQDPSIPVPLLLLTLTQAHLGELNPTHASGLSLDEQLDEFGIGKDTLAAAYGDRPKDWRPFGSQDTIEMILDSTRAHINSLVAPGGTRFRWDYVAEEFWSLDWDAFDQEVKRLNSGPAVVVVDPLALYHQRVEYAYTQRLGKFFENDDAFAMVLAPFSMPQSSQRLRRQLKLMAVMIFERFYDPPVLTRERYARCAANIGDGMDLRAWLLTAVGPAIRTSRSSAEPFLDPAT